MFDDEDEEKTEDDDDVFGDTAKVKPKAENVLPKEGPEPVPEAPIKKPVIRPGFSNGVKYPKNVRPLFRLGNSLAVRLPHKFVKDEFLAAGDLLQFDVWPSPFGRRITMHRVYLPKENK